MKYLTGIHALNLNCSLDTCGDWHQSALRWENLDVRDTGVSVFGEWGLEFGKTIPEHTGVWVTADHIRACLDILDSGVFGRIQGMRDKLICNADYTQVIFEKVMLLNGSENWGKIDKFMSREYMMEWVKFRRSGIYVKEEPWGLESDALRFGSKVFGSSWKE